MYVVSIVTLLTATSGGPQALITSLTLTQLCLPRALYKGPQGALCPVRAPLCVTFIRQHPTGSVTQHKHTPVTRGQKLLPRLHRETATRQRRQRSVVKYSRTKHKDFLSFSFMKSISAALSCVQYKFLKK